MPGVGKETKKAVADEVPRAIICKCLMLYEFAKERESGEVY